MSIRVRIYRDSTDYHSVEKEIPVGGNSYEAMEWTVQYVAAQLDKLAAQLRIRYLERDKVE
jgi:hypothetical protein